MNPIDTEDRVPALKDQHGIGYCNITKVLHARLPGAFPHHGQRDQRCASGVSARGGLALARI
jgi:hypothetical protein